MVVEFPCEVRIAAAAPAAAAAASTINTVLRETA
jgi:hypothetical protein